MYIYQSSELIILINPNAIKTCQKACPYKYQYLLNIISENLNIEANKHNIKPSTNWVLSLIDLYFIIKNVIKLNVNAIVQSNKEYNIIEIIVNK